MPPAAHVVMHASAQGGFVCARAAAMDSCLHAHIRANGIGPFSHLLELADDDRDLAVDIGALRDEGLKHHLVLRLQLGVEPLLQQCVRAVRARAVRVRACVRVWK